MSFGKSLLLWSLLVLVLAGALVATRVLRPAEGMQRGEALFPVEPETIVELTIEAPEAPAQSVTLERRGEFWRQRAPVAGLLCSPEAMSALFDALQAMRVVTPLGSASLAGFVPWRTLRVKTAERTIVCGLGRPADAFPAPLSQVLAEREGQLVAIEAGPVARLPKAPEALRATALIPVAAGRLQALEWHMPARPFTRVERRNGGHWQVTRPFPFDPKEEAVRSALEKLSASAQVCDYLFPTAAAPTTTSESALAPYGLDEERALRLTLHAAGLREAITLRFGKEDPQHPGQVFCLLDNGRAIASVRAEALAPFQAEGPFSTDFRNLPILGDVASPGYLSLRVASAEAAATLVKRGAAWQMLRPIALPANGAAVQALLEQTLKLAGDLVGIEPPATKPLAELTLAPSAQEAEAQAVTVQCFGDREGEKLLLYRADQSRLYRVPRERVPALLLQSERADLALRQALLDPTLLALPAAAIRRVAVLRRDGSSVVLRRASDTLAWEVEAPKGAFLDEATLDAWLTAFADLKAQAILCDAPTAFGALQPYGLDNPLLRITIDLDAQTDLLRRVLSIGTPDAQAGSAPALIQGRAVLYELGPETLELLSRDLLAPRQ